MLKSLGVTIAQVSQRLRSDDAQLPGDEAQAVVRQAERRRQLKTVVVVVVVFLVMVTVFSALFHELMDSEGRSYSWATSVYWTLTTMTTLGFGDITFESDAGRIFSIVVLLSGSTFLLVMLPFVFIQFVFLPWMNERQRRRAPRSLPSSTSGHLILTGFGPVESAVVERAIQAEVPYVVILEEVEEAGRYHDEGRQVMVGALDDPATYLNARVDRAAMVVATRNDPTNTNIAFTVREIAPGVEVLTTANSPAAVDILEIAGADHVVQLGEILGSAMAARTLGLGGASHVIGEFAGLKIAEAGVIGTAMVGRTPGELVLRSRFGVGIIGVWERGKFSIATADTRLSETSMLLLAGRAEQLAAFDEEYSVDRVGARHAVIIGGGRVGRAIGAAFDAEGVTYAIVEQMPERQRDGARYVIGDAADRSVLDAAGIDEASAVLITTHDDDVHLSADGVLMAFHDPDLRRTCGVDASIAELTATELADVRVDGREAIPTMVQLLDRFPDARFNIDCKSDDAAGPLVTLVRERDLHDRVCIGSFSHARLTKIRSLLGSRLLTCMSPQEIARLRLTGRVHGTARRVAQVPVRAADQGVGRRVTVVTARFVSNAHRHDVAVHVWTIDDPGEMHRLLDLGVDGIMTDRPEVLRDVLRARKSWFGNG